MSQGVRFSRRPTCSACPLRIDLVRETVWVTRHSTRPGGHDVSTARDRCLTVAGRLRAFVHSVRDAAQLHMTGVESPPGVRKRRVSLAVAVMIVVLLVQAQLVQATAEVVWTVIASWDEPDTDDSNNIAPLGPGDIDQTARPRILSSL